VPPPGHSTPVTSENRVIEIASLQLQKYVGIFWFTTQKTRELNSAARSFALAEQLTLQYIVSICMHVLLRAWLGLPLGQLWHSRIVLRGVSTHRGILSRHFVNGMSLPAGAIGRLLVSSS
jgi:hypothetical protein